MGSFKVVSVFYLCLVIQAIVGPCVLARDAGAGNLYYHSHQNRNNAKDQIQAGPVSNHRSNGFAPKSPAKEIEESPSFVPIPGTKIFEPIELEFPDIERTGAAAAEYKKQILAPLPSGARKDDANLIMTGESCARGLGSLYIVYDNAGEEILYSNCFDDSTASAIYSTHIIDLAGKEQGHSKHLGFKAKYTLYGWGIDKYYTARVQEEQFDPIFGEGLADHEIKKCNYFSRNHLTPHADFAEVENQENTYFFQNCFPGKQSMNAQNWSKLEDLVRKISIQLGKKLRIYTGTYGVLQKNNTAGELTDVYLDMPNKRVEVPLAVWKLVIDEATNDSVAFFTSNDIDMDAAEQSYFSTICKENVCDKLGYDFNPAPKAGFTICCKYEDFARHIKYLPVQLEETNLLMNPVHIENKNNPAPKRSWGRSKSVDSVKTPRAPRAPRARSVSPKKAVAA